MKGSITFLNFLKPSFSGSHDPLSCVSASTTLISATLAGVVFRPDNSSLLDLVSPLLDTMQVELSYKNKVRCHALFNSLVLINGMINILVKTAGF